MRLCYLASATSIHTAKWLNYFSSKGHHVDVLSFEPAKNLDASVQVHLLGNKWPLRMHYFSYGPAVRRLLTRIQPDILHAHYASGYATLGRFAGFHPYVVSVWGSDVFDFPKKSVVHRYIIRENLNSADRVCSTSAMMAEQIRPYCKTPVTVTPFGVDCQQFRPLQNDAQAGGEFVVGIVKALEPKYGVEYLVRGFAIASKRNGKQSKMRLRIVGDGSLRQPLEDLATDLGIAAQTEFLGFISHDDVPKVLSQFSVFVAPSILESESFGVAVLEASACGVPVVVSRIGGLPEVVQDRVTGLMIPPRDANAIAAVLEELREDKFLRAKLGRNGRDFVLQNYEWSENATRMERVYDSLLSDEVTSSI